MTSRRPRSRAAYKCNAAGRDDARPSCHSPARRLTPRPANVSGLGRAAPRSAAPAWLTVALRHQPDAAASLGRVEHGGIAEPAQPFQQPFHDRQVHAADQGGVLGGQGAERAVGQRQPGRVAPGLIPLVVHPAVSRASSQRWYSDRRIRRLAFVGFGWGLRGLLPQIALRFPCKQICGSNTTISKPRPAGNSVIYVVD
jgi:hypothetical protein